jgi:hypothetical protein
MWEEKEVSEPANKNLQLNNTSEKSEVSVLESFHHALFFFIPFLTPGYTIAKTFLILAG